METPPPRSRARLTTAHAIALIGLFLTAYTAWVGHLIKTGLAVYQSNAKSALAEMQHRQTTAQIELQNQQARTQIELENQRDSNRLALQHRQDSIQIAVGILSARAPKDSKGELMEFEPDQQRLRRWAIELLNDSAQIKIPSEAFDDIVKGRSSIRYGGDDWNYGSTDFYDYEPNSETIEKVDGKWYVSKQLKDAYAVYHDTTPEEAAILEKILTRRQPSPPQTPSSQPDSGPQQGQ